MNVSRAIWILPLLGALALWGCDANRVTDAAADETSLDDQDRIALEVIASPEAVQAAMDLIDVPLAAAARHGMGHAAQTYARSDATLARERFRLAVRALGEGDSVQAALRAREARRLVVRAMVAVGGARTVARMVERAEDLAARVGHEPARYTHSYQLQVELSGLASRAQERFRFHDSTGAGECAVLAEQRHRQRFVDPAALPGGAEVAVELAHTAVSLATRLVSEAGGPSDEQTTLLEVAAQYADTAGDALAVGDDAWALQLSDLAVWTTLEAVVWPDGVSPQEAAAMLELAEATYAAAAASEPTGVEADLLDWAAELIDFGRIAVEQAPPRGTGALWRASVICTWILG